MKKITCLLLFVLLASMSMTSCTVTSPTCLTSEHTRYQAQDNHGSRVPHCLTADAKRYQMRR
jgi:hypothetical protein